MTLFEQNILENRPFELSEAFEAVHALAREADHVCKADMQVNPALALLKLQDINERGKWIRREVERRIG